MGTVNVVLGEDTRLNLILGQQLENAVTEVVFDFSAWKTTYGTGTLALSVQRPGDDQPYAVTLTTSGTDATWSVTNLDTAYKGVGHIQLTYTVGTAIKKSVVYKFTVYESLGANGEYPSPGQTWQQNIEAEIGTLSNLPTTDKSSLVASINEIDGDITDVKQDLAQLDADIFGYNLISDGSYIVRNAGSSGSPNFTFSDGEFKIKRASSAVGNGVTIYCPVPQDATSRDYVCSLYVSESLTDNTVEVRGYETVPTAYNSSGAEVYKTYTVLSDIDETITFTIGNSINYIGVFVTAKTSQSDFMIGSISISPADNAGVIRAIEAEITEKVSEAVDDINDTFLGIEFVTPPVVNICGGIEQNFYYQNMVKGFNTKNAYQIGGNIKTQNYDYFGRLSPAENTSLENQGFVIDFYPYTSKSLLKSDPINYNVVPKTAGQGLTKKVLLIGDSLTFNQPLSKHLVDDLLDSDVMSVSLIGTLGTAPYLREGRSGWSAKDYTTGYTHGDSFTNAFWNPSTEKFDFSYYMANNNFDGVDYVFINLGTNEDESTPTEIANEIDEMVTSIHTYNANIRVGVWTPPPRALMNNWKLLDNDHTLDKVKAIIDKFKNRTSERVYVVPVTINVDPYYDFPVETVNVSNRNSSFQMVVPTDRTHPADAGYWKMSDMIYSYIKYFGFLDAT